MKINCQIQPMMLKALCGLLLLSTVSCATSIRQTEINEYKLQGPLEAGQRTRVLVLGTEHLQVLGDEFKPDLLNSLLDELQKFAPDVIAVESLPSDQIKRLVDSAGPSAQQLLAAFVGNTVRHGKEAQAVLGLTYDEAAALADSTPKSSETASPEARRLLVLRLLAAYDHPSSLLQWSYLSAEDRVADDAVSREIAEYLNKGLKRSNEIVSIGVALARRLNRHRIASIDDHIDDEVGLATGLNESLMPELQETEVFAELLNSPYFTDAQRRLPDAAATGDLLSLYLKINSPEHLNKDVEAQWHLFYRTHLESRLDRARAALWEARNLNIASNIRQATAFHSGEKILIVIGTAHKPFLDQYLERMMSVELVQLSEIVELK